MAIIIYPDGSQTTNLPEIQNTLGQIGITLRHWELPAGDSEKTLLEQISLSDDEKEILLKSVDHRFEELKSNQGYVTRDLIVLNDSIPGLDEMLAKFCSIHYHTDDEVRYILDGKGYFGFVDKNEKQFMVEVTAGDYINVPANTEHWFILGDSKRIKAVRYFIDTTGWTPVYTDRPLAFNLENAPH